MKKHIPNILTILNLVCGCFGIMEALKGELQLAERYMWLGVVFDFLDGFVARLLKVSSSIGKELDSFADLTTFGILPGFMMYFTIKENIDINSKYEILQFIHNSAFIIPALSALRLAKFNLDTSQTYHFTGMPTPACALLFASILNLKNPLILKYMDVINKNAIMLSLISILGSLLLISNIEFLAFKFKGISWRNNKLKYFFIIAILIFLIIFKKDGIFLALILYIIIAIIKNLLKKGKLKFKT